MTEELDTKRCVEHLGERLKDKRKGMGGSLKAEFLALCVDKLG
ncbi:hypothetical protein [Vibrio genomosp. F10]|nr:hypothetical protein [Vibrio genomosp. F10]